MQRVHRGLQCRLTRFCLHRAGQPRIAAAAILVKLRAVSTTPKIALVAGGSGLVGGFLINALLEAPEYSRVFALTRRPLGREHHKLANRIVVFARMAEQIKGMMVHEAFCCIGTTRAAAGSDEAFREADLDAVVAVHGMRLPLGSLLVARAFELWTHENDVRRVAGLPATAPDPATLRLMTELAVRMLPHGVARVAEVVPPLDVHLVLTGAGGGTWDVPLGVREHGTQEEVAIVADAVGFCRLVADRIGPAELGAHVSGATERVGTVLAGAAALALD